MKKTIAILLMLLAIFTLFACTPDEPETPKNDPPQAPAEPTVTFNFNTGTDEQISAITKDFIKLSEIEALPSPTKEGYSFKGWYTDSTLTNKFSLKTFSKQEKPESSINVPLYAKFEANYYTVTIHSSGGDTVSNFKYGAEIAIQKPSSAKLFAGFFEDKDFTRPFTTATMPAKNLDVYIKWVDSFNVTVKVSLPEALTLSGGALTQTISKTEKFDPIEAVARFGYAYSGYKIGDKTYTDSVIAINAEDITADTEITVLGDYATYELPIISVDTNNVPILNKYDYVDMTFNMINTDDEISDVTGGIRFRGNSTLGYPKKPYRIKFDSKQSLFGLTSAKSWVLLADYLDPSALHNYAAFGLADDGDFRFVASPHKVNLYLNGEYMGLFTLCEQMQENKGRINIETDITEDMVSIKDYNFFISMDGKVLEDDEAVEGETYFYLEDYDRYVEIKYPEKDSFPTEEQFYQFFSQLEEYMKYIFRIFSEKDVEAIRNEVNIDSLVDFFIIDQLMGENDHAAHSFNMFFANGTGDVKVDGKLNFGPIWDYDYCLHTSWQRRPNKEYDLDVKVSFSNVFFKAVGTTELIDVVKERYNSHYKDKIEAVVADIDALAKSMKISYELNSQKWYADYLEQEPYIVELNVEFLKSFLLFRKAMFDVIWAIDAE